MRGRRQLLPVLIGACLMLALPAVCRASMITVTNTQDTGSGSLRAAITSANPGDTITFSASLAGETIALGSTLPAITSGTTLTITGPTSSSAGITISGNNSVQIMQVNSGATLTLQYLTLQNGSVVGPSPGGVAQGGAISNSGKLTIADCTLSKNKATGGASNNNLGGSGQGGAIYNKGTMIVIDSTLSSNQATGGTSNSNSGGDGLGGAIYASGATTLTNVTFMGNEAVGGTGLPDGEGDGGAILLSAGTMTITNTTFSSNQAINGGPLGGAIDNAGGTVNLKGTILAASTGGNCGGVAVTASSSIVDDGTCGFTNGTNGNAVVTNTSDIGLAFGLANNGGPTQTIALVPGGIANTLITAPCTDQSSNPLNTDERGAPRPAPSHPTTCSAGAYEYNPQFFFGEVLSGSLYYLTFANSTFFGYYSYEFYPWLYHYHLGFEYVVDANDGASGVFFYDTSLGSYLYTNPDDFPVLWDYALGHWLYYVAGTSRQFYDFTTGMFFSSAPG